MGVFFRLGDAQLGEAQLAEVFPKDVFQLLVGEGHRHVGHGGIVLRGAHEMEGEAPPGPLEAGKGWVHQGAGEFPGPVRAEVEEDNAVSRFQVPPAGTDHRFHELIGDAGVVGGLDGLEGIGEEGTLSVGHGVVGPLQAVPPLVPVHGVVTAHDVGDLTHPQGLELGLKLADISQPRSGGDVPPV